MLFDLRGRGRRRTIQVIYLFLAVLIGGGLIFFGVGGTGVGLFNNDNNQGSSGSISNTALKSAEKQVRLHPKDPNAWANLTRRRFQSADYDSNQQVFTNQAQLRQVAAAYQRYRALEKGKLDASLLQQMITVYGETGLADFTNAAKVADDLTTVSPKSVTAFEQLAIYAKVAGQDRQAALAQQQAVSLADGKQAAQQVKQVISQQTKALQQALKQAAGASSGGTTTGG